MLGFTALYQEDENESGIINQTGAGAGKTDSHSETKWNDLLTIVPKDMTPMTTEPKPVPMTETEAIKELYPAQEKPQETSQTGMFRQQKRSKGLC